jgi:hypothetical protein
MKTIAYFFILLYSSTYTIGQNTTDTLANTMLPEDSTKIKIMRLNINSENSDFSPFIFNKQLLFVSGRNNNAGVKYVDVNDESEITDIYSSLRVDSIKYKNTKSFDATINTKYYEGPFCINKKGTLIYFTANDKKSGLLKIYKSEKIDNRWTKPEMMSFCKSEFSYCYPTLSYKEDQMIFSANLSGAKNKLDLFRSENDNGIWSPAIAMSKKINDSTNQVFPFINSKNILYYSSDKKTGLGGLDIYSIDLNYDTSTVMLLPHPINSSFDDFGVWIDSTSTTGYFSSNRNARYKDDIYYFANCLPDFSNWKKIVSKNNLCFTFFEEATLATKDTVNLTYEWNFGDGIKGRGLKTRHCFAGPGIYNVQLNIIDKNSGEVFMNETSTDLVIEKPDQLLIECVDSVIVGKSIIINSKSCHLKGYQLNKMYWSFGDGKYNSGSTVKHVYAIPGTYKIEMGLLAKNINSNKIEQFKAEKKITVTTKN